MDFGIAGADATRRLTFAGFSRNFGTPHYMAPEQLKGARGDGRTDLYSLGAILYEMGSGHAPYDEQADVYSVMSARLSGDPVAPRTHNPAMPAEVEEIILRALERDPDDRYPCAAAMKRDLEAPERVQVTGRAGRLRRPAPHARRWRLARIAALALVIPVALFF